MVTYGYGGIGGSKASGGTGRTTRSSRAAAISKAKAEDKAKVDQGGFTVRQGDKLISYKFKEGGGIEKGVIIGGAGKTSTQVYTGKPTTAQLAAAKAQVAIVKPVQKQGVSQASVFGTQLPSTSFSVRETLFKGSRLRQELVREKDPLERRREAITSLYTKFKSGEKKLARATTEKIGFLKPSVSLAQKKAVATAEVETFGKVSEQAFKEGEFGKGLLFRDIAKGAKTREFGYGFLMGAKKRIREKPATLAITGLVGTATGGASKVFKVGSAGYKLFKYGSYVLGGAAITAIIAKLATTPREKRGEFLGGVAPDIAVFGGGAFLGAKATGAVQSLFGKTEIVGRGKQVRTGLKIFDFKGEVRGQQYKSRVYETPEAIFEKGKIGETSLFKKTTISGVREYQIKGGRVFKETFRPSSEFLKPQTKGLTTTILKAKPQTRLSFDPKKQISTFEVGDFATTFGKRKISVVSVARKGLLEQEISASIVGKTTVKARSQFETAQLTGFAKTDKGFKVLSVEAAERFTRPKFKLGGKTDLGKPVYVAEETPIGFLRYRKTPVKTEKFSFQKDVGFYFKSKYTEQFKGVIPTTVSLIGKAGVRIKRSPLFPTRMLRSKKAGLISTELITKPIVGVTFTPTKAPQAEGLRFTPLGETIKPSSKSSLFFVSKPTGKPRASQVSGFDLTVGVGKTKLSQRPDIKSITRQIPELKAIIKPITKQRTFSLGRTRSIQEQKPIQEQKIIPDQIIEQKQITTTDLIGRKYSRLRQDPVIFPRTGVFTPKPFDYSFGKPFIPAIGSIWSPKISGGGRGRRRRRETTFSPKYFPSVEAVIFKIKGKKPSKGLVSTGLVLRPIIEV